MYSRLVYPVLKVPSEPLTHPLGPVLGCWDLCLGRMLVGNICSAWILHESPYLSSDLLIKVKFILVPHLAIVKSQYLLRIRYFPSVL